MPQIATSLLNLCLKMLSLMKFLLRIGDFRSIFLGEFFWENFFGRIIFGGILWEEFFVYDGVSRFCFLSRFCLNKEGRKEGKKFRSLEVRRKLIALKNKIVF